MKRLQHENTALKESVFGVILVSIFPAFSRIRTEYGEIIVSLRIQSECGKIVTRITPSMDYFYAVKE